MEQPNNTQSNQTDNTATDKTGEGQQPQQKNQDSRPQSRESAMRALARELASANGKPSEKDGESDDKIGENNSPQQQQTKPKVKLSAKNIAELAEALNVDVKDLYDLEIPSSREGEQPYKLGAMKDHMVEREEFTVRSLAFDESKRKAEADIVRANAELQEIFNMLPANAIKPEAREMARNRVAKQRQVEGARTLNAIPEWRDEKARESDLGEMIDHLSSYGFDESYISNLYDHRMMKMLRDFTKQTKNLQRALALVTGSKSKTPNTSNKERKPAQKNGASETRRQATSGTHEAKRERFLNEVFGNNR